MKNLLFSLTFIFCFLGFAKADIYCPETLLQDFKVKVKSKDQAHKIFQSYFSQTKGFPAFDGTLVYVDDSPSCSGSSSVKSTCYFYSDMYGAGPSGIGGYLYPNGKLVKRGYCK